MMCFFSKGWRGYMLGPVFPVQSRDSLRHAAPPAVYVHIPLPCMPFVPQAQQSGCCPWALSFSFGRALQHSVLKTWAADTSKVEVRRW